MSERWLYHITVAGDYEGGELRPRSLASEGFVHCSYQGAVAESARLYFPAGAALEVLQLDPRRLPPGALRVAETPRGPMPHVHCAVPAEAVRARLSLDGVMGAPDLIA